MMQFEKESSFLQFQGLLNDLTRAIALCKHDTLLQAFYCCWLPPPHMAVSGTSPHVSALQSPVPLLTKIWPRDAVTWILGTSGACQRYAIQNLRSLKLPAKTLPDSFYVFAVGYRGLRGSEDVVPCLQPTCERQIVFDEAHLKRRIRHIHLFWLVNTLLFRFSCSTWEYFSRYCCHVYWLCCCLICLRWQVHQTLLNFETRWAIQLCPMS